jgi:uncharacterized RDD family membrane protein YckC
VAGRGVRFAAFVVDFVLLKMLLWTVLLVVPGGIAVAATPESLRWKMLQQFAVTAVLWFAYFVVLEGLWGCSPGKRLLDLRVAVPSGRDRPGWGQVVLRFVVFYLLLSLEEIVLLPLLGSSAFATAEGLLQLHYVTLSLHPLKLIGIGLLLSTMRRRNGWRGVHEFASNTCVIQLPETTLRRPPSGHFFGEDLSLSADIPQRVGPFEVRGALRWDEEARVLWGEDLALGRSLLLWLRPKEEPPLSSARRACARPTRLRWLASGQHDAWQWDAFPAPTGRPVVDLVAADGPLRWPQLRPLLEQLSEELAAATRDDTLPSPLSVSEVWVQSDGGALLLDAPLRRIGAPSLADEPRPNALALLSGAAGLALEGLSARNTGPVRAIVPLHASRLLDRLRGEGTPYHDVPEFQTELEESHGEPTRVTPGRRAAHLVVLAALLSVGLLFIFLAVWLADVPALVSLREMQKEGQLLTQRIERRAASDFVAGTFAPSPLAATASVYRSIAEMADSYRLREFVDQDERLLQARVAGANWLNRNTYNWVEDFIDQTKARPLREEAAHVVRAQRRPGHVEPNFRQVALLGLQFWPLWPLLWVVSAFVFRGGVSYLLTGLALVGSDGRPASRLRCAWRAVLVWLPLTAMMLEALLLNGWYWSAAMENLSRPWMLWGAEAFRWSALGLLATYALLAIRSPEQSLHDRMAGTYLVPR